jgi:hypothetical protein
MFVLSILDCYQEVCNGMKNVYWKVCLLCCCVSLLATWLQVSATYLTPSTYAHKLDFLHYSTYIGGIDAECIQDICIDQTGCAYITGWTRSDFISSLRCSSPIPGFDQTLNGDIDAFVIKISPDGKDILYASYIGGENNEVGFSIAVNAKNEVFVSGWTQSTENTGFPIGGSIPGYDTTHNHFLDGFICKISSDGEKVLYSTFIGGYYRDVIFSMNVDKFDRVTVAGWTESSMEDGFPIGHGIPGYDHQFHGERDGFILQLSSDGKEVSYSTYIGGSEDDIIQAIVMDDQQKVFATGWTKSSYKSGFLQTNHKNNSEIPGYQKEYQNRSDVFVLCLSLQTNQIIYNTYIGGTGDESPHSLALDKQGCCYVVGKTDSSPEMGFPVLPLDDGFDKTIDGENDGFVIKLHPMGTDILYSTYIGGSYYTDTVSDICITKRNSAYITGWTNSTFEHGFPIGQIGNRIIPGNDTQENGHFDVFLMELSSDGNDVLYSTYIGGTGPEWSYCIAQDADGNVFIAGNTETTPEKGFPIGKTIPGHQSEFQGLQDGYVWKIGSIPQETILVDITLKVGHPLALVHPSNAIESMQVEMDCHPLFDGNHYLVPLRFLGDSFGASVHWDPKKEVATIQYFNHFVTFWPNRKGTEQPNLVVQNLISKQSTSYHAVQNCIQNGRILFDLRYVEEIFKAEYSTESSGKNISIQARFQRIPSSIPLY